MDEITLSYIVVISILAILLIALSIAYTNHTKRYIEHLNEYDKLRKDYAKLRSKLESTKPN